MMYDVNNIIQENKIKQNIELNLDSDTLARTAFTNFLRNFVKEHGKQEIEGVIESFNIYLHSYRNSVIVQIVSLKEDKLKLLTTTDVMPKVEDKLNLFN